jgi:predicted acetyltransferase
MLTLRELTETDKPAFLAGLKAWEGENLAWHTFEWKPGMSFTDHLAKLRNNRAGIGLLEGRVPSTMFYGFVDGEIIGRVNVRHQLTENLLVRGGHIGYAVAPRFRRRGYATEMVRQALPYLRTLGIPRALITCDDGNAASCKIIEGIGGQLENKIWDSADQKMVRRYWVKL